MDTWTTRGYDAGMKDILVMKVKPSEMGADLLGILCEENRRFSSITRRFSLGRVARLRPGGRAADWRSEYPSAPPVPTGPAAK